MGWAELGMVVILELSRPRQENHKFQVSLGYTMSNLVQKQKNQPNRQYRKPAAVFQRSVVVVSVDSSRQQALTECLLCAGDTQRAGDGISDVLGLTQ